TVASPTVSGLAAGSYVFALVVTDSKGLPSSPSSVTVTVNPAPTSSPPVASAGANQTITLPTSSVTLAGSGTAASGATITAYSWSQSSGPNTATFSSKTIANPTVSGLVAGSYVFALVVTDSKGLTSSPSSVTVTVNPAPTSTPPVASAGSNQTITLPTSSTTLSGSGTAASGATITGYSWSQSSGPTTAAFSGKTVANPTVSSLVAGSYVFALVVTDSKGLSSSPSSVTVTVNPAPTSSGQQVVSFTLINADSDQPIRQLVANDVLNLATLPTQNLSIRANTSPATVGSVLLSLSGAQTQRTTDRKPPYALPDDANGNYTAWRPPLGTYTLTATPYTGNNANGTAGTALTLAFSVTNQAARPAALATATAAVAAPAAVEVYPNPSASGRFHLAFRAAVAGPVAYELISAVGATVGQGTLSLPAGSSEQVLELGGRLTAPGLYYLRLHSAQFSHPLKLLWQP
ncbi:hypothetical protein SAMN06265337_4337, partial [Hymenobacter gelipurpurascens]